MKVDLLGVGSVPAGPRGVRDVGFRASANWCVKEGRPA